MNDQELITAVRQSVHGVRMNVPAEQIVSRSRAIRARGHRRLAAGISAGAAAGSAVLGLGLTGVFGAAPARSVATTIPARSTGTIAASARGTIRTTAFTLTANDNGTDTLTINPRVLLDPGTLQNDLAQYGIPAKVTAGSFCSSDPAPTGFRQVVTFSPAAGSPASGPPAPGNRVRVQNPTITIDPAAMPAGTELSFGNFQLTDGQETAFALIDTNSYTCTSTAPTAPIHMAGAVVLTHSGPGQ